MNTLTLTIAEPWFSMIRDGKKKEEYREIKPHYIRQFIKFEPLKNDLIRDYNFHRGYDDGEINGIDTELVNLQYDRLALRNGYRADSPKITLKNPRIRIGQGRPEWGAELGKNYFVITWEE